MSIILASVMGVLFYVSDMSTDIYCAFKYFSNGDDWWGGWTVAFIILPLLVTGIVLIYFAKDEIKNNCLLGLAMIVLVVVCAPIVPIGILVWNVIDNIRRYPENGETDNNRSTSNMATAIVRICEAVTESFPQAGLQTYIVFQALRDGKAIGIWQWLTIAMSLIALAYAISGTSLLGQISIYLRIILFIFTLMAITSRLLVCSVYSIIHSGLWFVPIGTELAAFIGIWAIKKCCDCDMWKWNTVIFVVSTCNLWFAVGGYYMVVPQVLRMTALVLACISSLIQLILWKLIV